MSRNLKCVNLFISFYSSWVLGWVLFKLQVGFSLPLFLDKSFTLLNFHNMYIADGKYQPKYFWSRQNVLCFPSHIFVMTITVQALFAGVQQDKVFCICIAHTATFSVIKWMKIKNENYFVSGFICSKTSSSWWCLLIFTFKYGELFFCL